MNSETTRRSRGCSGVTDTEKNPSSHPSQEYPPPGQAWYMVAVLTITYIFSFGDRQILNLLVGPIREDLHINDTQMSLLMGFGFAFFYAIFGLFAGRLADSMNRKRLITLGIAFWSMMTTACGLAQKYWQFLLFRFGVGIGQSTLSPCAFSLISDSFPPERRGAAIRVYCTAIYIGSGLASILGALMIGFTQRHSTFTLPLLGTIRSWKLIFLIVGITEVFLSLLMFFFKEPTRKGVVPLQGSSGDHQVSQKANKDFFGYVRANKATFFCHFLGFSLIGFSNYGTAAWIPTLFVRRHGWTPTEIGLVLGCIVMVCGTMGVWVGGRLCDWLTKKGYRDATMRIGLCVVLAWLPTGILYPLMPNAYLAIGLYIPTIFLTSMPYGISNAAMQEIVPNNMRGQSSSAFLFVFSLISVGLGPTSIAVLTDYVFHDSNAIHYSMLLVSTTAQLSAAVLLYCGLKPFGRTLNYLKEWNRKHSHPVT